MNSVTRLPIVHYCGIKRCKCKAVNYRLFYKEMVTFADLLTQLSPKIMRHKWKRKPLTHHARMCMHEKDQLQ